MNSPIAIAFPLESLLSNLLLLNQFLQRHKKKHALIMIFFIISLSGIAGTALMTLFLYLLALATRRQLKVVKILGTLITNQTTPQGGLSNSPLAIWTGIVAHYLVGILFAFCYYFLWNLGIGAPTIPSGMVFGFVSGLFGIAIWTIVFHFHPNPPHNVSLKIYLPTLVIAHIVFGIGVNIAYAALR